MDGNCLFSAIAHQLHVIGIERVCPTASAVRAKIVDLMEGDGEFAVQASHGIDKGLQCYVMSRHISHPYKVKYEAKM